MVYEIHSAAISEKVDCAWEREFWMPTVAMEKCARGVEHGRCVAVAFAAVVKEVVTAFWEIFHSNWPDFVTAKPRTPAWYILIIPISGQLWGLLFLFRPPLWEVRHETNRTAEMEDVQFLTELAKNERRWRWLRGDRTARENATKRRLIWTTKHTNSCTWTNAACGPLRRPEIESRNSCRWLDGPEISTLSDVWLKPWKFLWRTWKVWEKMPSGERRLIRQQSNDWLID